MSFTLIFLNGIYSHNRNCLLWQWFLYVISFIVFCLLQLTIQPEDLLPQLPNPKDLQPFPTVMSMVYEGHTDMVRSIAVEPRGQYMVSGSDDLTVKGKDIIEYFSITDLCCWIKPGKKDFCMVPPFCPSLNIHLLSETILNLLTCLNFKEFKGNLQLYVTPDIWMVYEVSLGRLNLLTLQLRRRHLDTLSLMFIKVKFVAYAFWILLLCTYPLAQSQTTIYVYCAS